jgi:hypothetical protein
MWSILLFIYAVGAFGGLMSLSNDSPDWIGLIAVLLWPITLIFIIFALIFKL